METLHNRLDSQRDEVLRVTEVVGRFKAMRQFKVHDYKCFAKWLKEVTGDENFGFNPKISLNSRETMGEQLVNAFLRKVAELESENERLRWTIKVRDLQLTPGREMEDLQTMAVMQVCQV